MNWEEILNLHSTKYGGTNCQALQCDGNWTLYLHRKSKENLSEDEAIQSIKQAYGLQQAQLDIKLNHAISLPELISLCNLKIVDKSIEQLWAETHIGELSSIKTIADDGNTSIIKFQDPTYYYCLFCEIEWKA